MRSALPIGCLLNGAHIKITAMSQIAKRANQIVIYSDDSSVRAAIKGALGVRLSADFDEHVIHEFATGAALRAFADKKPVDLFILDGEAVPEGGMGIARQLKDEVFNCPPVLLITGRKDDAWLAAWSLAEASVVHPIDPFTLANCAADLLRNANLRSA